jgi:ribonuclease HI
LVLTRGRSALEAENYANQDLKKIENWARENKMQFNENKSKVLLVTRKTTEANATLRIYLNNKRLEQVSELKYLGIYFDSRFRFDRHVNYITGKCASIIHMLSKSAKLKWGLRHRALKVIYSGAIEPILTYGAPVFEKALENKNNLRKYQSVQRMLNIKIAKAYRTLSYEASCVLAGIRPIRLAIEEKARNYRATHNNEFDAPLEVKQWPHPAEIPSLKAHIEIPLNAINIFTDGSKIGGKVGAAAVIIKDDIVLHQSKYKLHDRCSNNQAEQVAIQKALEQLQYLPITDDKAKTVVVNTDSRVALDTLRNRKKHNILIENTRKELKRLEYLQWTVIFNWVKAHAGTQGNEMADRLAKEAATEDTEEIVYNKIPRETIITEGKEDELTKWQEQWTSSKKGAVSKLFFPHIKERMKTKLPISAEFTAMVTGHGFTRSYLHRFKVIQNPTCPCGLNEEQTINHLLLTCTQLEKERRIMRNDIVRTGDTWPPPFDKFITKHIQTFTKFVNSIDFNTLYE